MDKKFKEALIDIVNYLYLDEMSDHDLNGPDDEHIFHSIRILKEEVLKDDPTAFDYDKEPLNTLL